MKYFSHDCDAGAREWLSLLHEKFGHEGYSLWFQILEVLGEEIDKEFEKFQLGSSKVVRPIMKIGLKWLSNRVKSSEKATLDFIGFCKKHGKYSIARCSKRDGTVTIEVPNFLRRIDEYAKKAIRATCKSRGITPDTVLTVSGQTPDNVRTLSGQKKRKEIKRKEIKGEGGRAARAENAPAPPETASPGTTEPAPPARTPETPPDVPPEAEDSGHLPTEDDLEALEVACDVKAFEYCETPGTDAKRRAIRELRRLGRSHEHIRHAAGLDSSQTRGFFEIVNDLEKKRIPPPFRASPPAERPSVLSQPILRERLVAAQEEADRRISEMPPGEVTAWTREEESEAALLGLPPMLRASLVRSRLRLRVAERFGIEGLSKTKELA